MKWYSIDIVKTYMKCFVLNFLDIAYCLPLKTNSLEHRKVFINLFNFNLGSIYVKYYADAIKNAARPQKGVANLSNSRNVYVCLIANPETTSHLGQSPPRQ